jgi:hypothetical protein
MIFIQTRRLLILSTDDLERYEQSLSAHPAGKIPADMPVIPLEEHRVPCWGESGSQTRRDQPDPARRHVNDNAMRTLRDFLTPGKAATRIGPAPLLIDAEPQRHGKDTAPKPAIGEMSCWTDEPVRCRAKGFFYLQQRRSASAAQMVVH